jgi:cytochrome c peroxidase
MKRLLRLRRSLPNTTRFSRAHFYNTRDLLPRCQPHDVGEGATCWPAPDSTENMNTSRVGRLGLSDAKEDAIVSFLQTLTDVFMSANHSDTL